MRRNKATITPLALVVLAGSLTGCWGNRSEEPPVHIIWNMDFQARWDAQEKTDMFEDGRIMRAPVEGTVARGFLKEDDLLWRGRGFDGRLADELPASIELDAELLERGRERYDIYCSPCHDHSGRGQGPTTLRGGGFKVAPANLHQERLLPMPLGYFYEIITEGKMPNMLPYAAQIPVEDRWAIAVWVRALQIYGKDKDWAGAVVAADASDAPDPSGAVAPAANKEGSR
ncbi:hypothetical protein ENSA5_30450 [Enhygromyxa salina]|uniref:Cytochrome c domain-containing protein n=1 Tax=Enhygromyxa salina TaxID=215803 RepID=A0A2S9XZM0_9BACT|nr:c-type cytochrome [Enhygromyxa salina]PRP98312.1 hypothetical protein ENSA5_30450 [Enhygromyxa salina]